MASDFSNPFPGLRSYEYAEYPLFFGRDGQSVEILRRLRRRRFVSVIGISGSGKSSLIRAGLLPFLDGALLPEAGSHWRKAIFRPGNTPIKNLACELAKPGILGPPSQEHPDPMDSMFVEATLRSGGLGLIQAVQQAHLVPRENVLIIVDQMEELFRFAKLAEEGGLSKEGDEASAFVKLLLEAARQREVPVYVVITMRSDFIGDCARFRDLPETVNEGLYLIPRMTRDQRREAIVGPVEARGQEIAPRLVNRLLNDVGDSPDQLPLLQHALMRTYDRWLRDHEATEPIDIRHYEAIGGIQEALSRHALEAFDELPDDRHREIAKRTFQCLTEKGLERREVRRPSRISEIMIRTGAPFAQVSETIETFRQTGRSFLMPPPEYALNQNSLIDISHESLIAGWPQLRKWVDDEAQSAAVFRRLADTAVLHQAGEAGLYHDPDLQIALTWRDREKPNEEWALRYHPDFRTAMTFLDESRAARDSQLHEIELRRKRELNRNRLVAGILSLAGLIALAFGISAHHQKKKANLYAQAAQRSSEENKGLADDADRHRKQIAVLFEDQKRKAEQLIGAKQDVDAALHTAQLNEAKVNHAAENFREEALQAKENLVNDQETINAMADNLIGETSPQSAIYAHKRKATALSQVGNHEQAAAELTKILDTEPGNLPALVSRGYEYLLLGKIDDSVRDTERYLQNAPRSSVAHLNLGVALAIQGKYQPAIDSIHRALLTYDPSDSGMYESELAPDIRQATGHDVLVQDNWQYELALRYELAVLAAVEGGPHFTDRLKEADEHAKHLPASAGPLYVALNWDWLHYRDRGNDYGAFAAAGALWERLSEKDEAFQGCAKLAFQRFQHYDQERKDPRYSIVSKWVSTRIPLQKRNATCGAIPPEKMDPHEPALLARELQNQFSGSDLVKNAHVHQQISRAIELARKHDTNPDVLVDLLTRRARIRYDAGDTLGARRDSNEIIKFHPAGSSTAYYYLAMTDLNDKEKAAHFEKALEADPADPTVLDAFSEFLARDDPSRALDLSRRCALIWSSSPSTRRQVATLEHRLNQDRAALHSIDIAISLNPLRYSSYELRSQIEAALGATPSVIALHLSKGYLQAGNSSRHQGENDNALVSYLKGLQSLSTFVDSGDPDIRFQIELSIRNISEFLETNYSRKYAAKFWQSVSDTPEIAPFKNLIISEDVRLSAADHR